MMEKYPESDAQWAAGREPDLGQKAAEAEKLSDEKLEHMGGSGGIGSQRQRNLGQKAAANEKLSDERLSHMAGEQHRGAPRQKPNQRAQ